MFGLVAEMLVVPGATTCDKTVFRDHHRALKRACCLRDHISQIPVA